MRKYIIWVLALVVVAATMAGCIKTEVVEEKGNDSVDSTYEVINTDKVSEALKDEEWVVVDTRLNDAFNGWKLDGISRGGRISGAVDFSANWLLVDEKGIDDELNDILIKKGIDKEKNIVLYDANGKDAKSVAEYLNGKGYKNLYLYDVKEWAKDESLPMISYKNYEKIVPAVVVKDILDGKIPDTFEDSNIKIVEASWGEEKTSYAKGHIPTAFHINTDVIEPPTETEPVMWMLADDDTLDQFARDYGFTKDDTVVVTSEEPLAAYRVATVLRYMGVKDVRVLNGGISQWVLAGYDLEKVSNKPTPVESFGAAIPANPSVIDTMEEVKAGLSGDTNFTLIDNRTWDEHIGESSGYSYHNKKGRVPGSVFGYAGINDAYALDYYRNPDKTMINADEFLSLWKQQGIDTSKHLSFMCGSGWRVAEIYTYASIVGLEDISIFSDGWIGWSNTPNNPIETGEPNN